MHIVQNSQQLHNSFWSNLFMKEQFLGTSITVLPELTVNNSAIVHFLI